MQAEVEEKLIAINRSFYSSHAEDFSATRQRLQPGVTGILASLQGNEAIIDVGCGNGELVRALDRRGHQGAYCGLDFSVGLLSIARARRLARPAQFVQMDIAEPAVLRTSEALKGRQFALALAFAVLHHLPGRQRRADLLEDLATLMQSGARLFLSNWQFLADPRWASRIQPWSAIGLSANDVDAGDYLLDWRRGGSALRYVHLFGPDELEQLAAETGFQVMRSWWSDGVTGRSGLYQEWEKQR